MSDPTATRDERNVEVRASEALTEDDKEFVAKLKKFSGESEPINGDVGQGVNNSASSPAGNFLPISGGPMNGPFALGPPLDFTIEVDANNTINISKNLQNPQYSSNVQLDDLQPNSSVLDIIAGAAFDGQVLILRSFAPTVPYTISQGTLANGGNMQTPDENDIVFGDLQMLVVIFDEALVINNNTGGTWRVLAGVGGGGAVDFPIDFPEAADRGTVVTDQTINFALSTRHSELMTVGTATITLDFSNPPTDKLALSSVTMKQDGTGGRTFSFVQTVVNAGTITDAFAALGPNESISFMIEWERGVWTAYLKTGNTVSGGGGDASQWATFPAVDDVDFATFDGINVDRFLFANDSGGFASNSDVGFVRNSTQFNRNVATGTSHNWMFNNQINMTLRQVGTPLDTLFDVQANTGLVIFNTFRDNIPNDGADIFNFHVHAQNGGTTTIRMAEWNVEMEQNDIGDESASTHWRVKDASLMELYLSLNNNRDGKITLWKSSFLDTGANIELNSNKIYFETDAEGTRVEKDATFDNIDFYVEGDVNRRLTVSNAGITVGATGTNSKITLNNFLHFIPTDAVPLGLDGEMWYDDSENKFKGVENGVTVDFISGAGTNIISQLDSKVEVLDTGSDGRVEITTDNTLRYQFTNTAFEALVVGMNLGDATTPWVKFNVMDIEIETGGSITINKNNIVSDGGGTTINTPDGDALVHAINGVDNITFSEDEIEFQVGRAHRISATNTSLQLLSENINDSVQIWPGTGRSNEAFIVQDLNSIFKSAASGTDKYQLLIRYSNATTTGQPGLGGFGFEAEDSLNVFSAYGGIVAAIDNDTSTNRNGRTQLVVADGNTAASRGLTQLTGIGLDIQGNDGNGVKLALWGVAPVVQPAGTGETIGFTAGSGTGVNDDSTFTGNLGASAYRISDIVKALKQSGNMAL